MTPKQEKILHKKYPEMLMVLPMYLDKDNPNKKYPIGLDCGDGWFDLIDALCDHITSMCKNNDWEIPTASQIKEKYGGLRFYTNGVDPKASETVFGSIGFAEALSYRICEECGKHAECRNDIGWIRTLCKTHYNEEYKKIKGTIPEREPLQ